MLKDLVFKVADDDERQQELSLRAEVYTRDLGHIPDDGMDELSHHLVACRDGEVIAAVRVVGPEHRPFEMEQFVTLSEFIGRDRTPGCIGRLCTRSDQRGVTRNAFVQLGMLKLACSFGRREGLTDFVMYTFPYLVAFYRGAFFQEWGVSFDHPEWGRMFPMHLDLLALEARCMHSQDPLARLIRANLPNVRV